jgi:hypothetical protein
VYFHDFELRSQNSPPNVGVAGYGVAFQSAAETPRRVSTEQEAQGRHGLRRRHRLEIVNLSGGLSGHLRMKIHLHLRTLAERSDAA